MPDSPVLSLIMFIFDRSWAAPAAGLLTALLVVAIVWIFGG
jgi:hypothetical protein